MLSVIKPYTTELNRSLPFPGDINNIADFLFTFFNRDVKKENELLSRKIILEWLENFLELHNTAKIQLVQSKQNNSSNDDQFYWDYDDANDLRMK